MLYLVRHCATTGQAPEAPLTEEGSRDAEALAGRLGAELAGAASVRIVSSPYRRALATIEPFAARAGLAIETDERLVERRLSPAHFDGWRDVVRRGFSDPAYALPGCESAGDALARGWASIRAVAESGHRCPVVVSHGQLLSLVFHALDPGFGYDGWQSLSNPDVFVLEGGSGAFERRRIWT